MSEKRFTIDNTNRIFDNKDIMSKTEVVVLLNALDRECNKLRIKKLQFENRCTDLEKENRKLRQKLIQEMKLHQETEEELQEYKSFMGLR